MKTNPTYFFTAFFYFFTAVFLSGSKGLSRNSKKVEIFFNTPLKN